MKPLSAQGAGCLEHQPCVGFLLLCWAECRDGTQHAGSTPGSGAGAIPAVVTVGSPEEHSESKESNLLSY